MNMVFRAALRGSEALYFVMDTCVGIVEFPLVRLCSRVQLQSSSNELTSRSCPSSSNMMESTGEAE